jgi:hypothetical protein
VVAKDISPIPAAERKFTYIDEITVEEVYAAAHDLFTHPGCEKGPGEKLT